LILSPLSKISIPTYDVIREDHRCICCCYRDGKYVRVSKPTEAAVKVLVEKMGLSKNVPEQIELIQERKI